MKFSKPLLILAFVTFLSFNLKSQPGTLRGKIIDGENGEPLIGATIVIPGTTTGTMTDFDGNYSLRIEPGKHTIKISYVSYNANTYDDINIKANEVTVLNSTLKKSEVGIEEVVVKGEIRRKRTEVALQVMQKKSANLLDGISAQQISKLGDSDAAQALKRVTGISIQNGKYVYIRGLSDRYTKTTLNGAEIPGIDPEKNTVQMDIFPSNIIENIIVNKSLTPDLPGESTGGHIDIVTQDFPHKFTMQFSTSLGYNPYVNLNPEFITYEGGQSDWLGYDDGTRDIPDNVKDIMQVRNGIFATLDPNNPDLDEMDEVRSQLNEVTTSFNKQYEPIKKQSFLNQGYKFSIGNQTRFFGKPLGYNAALSYSKDYGYFKDGIYQVSENETIDPWKEVNDQYGEIDVKITGLVNLNYKLSNNHKIGARFLKTQSGLDVARYREGYYGYETGFHIQERNLGFLERSLNVGQLEGKHILKNLNKTKIEWLTSYTFMRQDEPDLRYFPNLYTFNDNGEKENFRVFSNTSPVRYYREMFEHNMNAKIDITIPVRIASESSKFKFGGFYANKLRESDEFKFKFSGDTWVFPSGDIEELLNQPISIDNPNGFFYEEDMKSDRILSYYGNQNSYGGYSMLDVSFSKIIRIVAGARIESSYIFVENKIAKTNSNYSDGELNELDVLPSINLTYHVIQNMNVRLGYFRTLARPIFKEISPTSYYDYKKGERINGNPDLERSLIDNFDLRWEYFFKPSEMVSISGFYKYFQNPIEMQMNEKQINREIQYINSDDSYLYGLEAEFRKSLDFFTPLKDFFIATNLSLIKSVTQVNDSITDRAYREETRPMMGQSPYILNSYLEYNNKNIQLNTNITFHTSGEKLIIITKPGTPYIYEQPFPLFSFNLSKGIGEYISINFKLKNIFNKSYEAVYHYDQMDYTYLKHKTGRTYSLGIKYLIK